MWHKNLLSPDKWMYFLLKFYELCGFHNTKRHATVRRPVKCTFVAFQVLLLYHFTLNGLKYILAISQFMERLGILNFTLFYGAALVSFWIVMIESYGQKSVQEAFWSLHVPLNDAGLKNSMKRQYLCRFGIHLILFVTMLFVSAQDQNTTADAVMTYYVLLFMCNNRLFYFLLYLKLIKFELQQIYSDLITCRSFEYRDEFQMRKKICTEYQRVCEMADCVNGFFGWSHFATILLSFYTLLTYLNFIYQVLDRQFDGHGLFLLNPFFI